MTVTDARRNRVDAGPGTGRISPPEVEDADTLTWIDVDEWLEAHADDLAGEREDAAA